MADNETIADIIAWLRRPREGENAYLTLWRDEIADRLEAAHRRERGDAAMLREAAVKCCEIALQWQADEAAGVAGTTDKPHARSAAEAVIDMEFEINAALAAPPRNCDIPAVCDDPHRAWLNDKDNWNEDGDPKLEIYDWLLASATEREGGAK